MKHILVHQVSTKFFLLFLTFSEVLRVQCQSQSQSHIRLKKRHHHQNHHHHNNHHSHQHKKTCIPNLDENCLSKIFPDPSICSFSCPGPGDGPICGSDGLVYDSRCILEKEACLLRLRHQNKNDEDSSSSLQVDETGRKCHFLGALGTFGQSSQNDGFQNDQGNRPLHQFPAICEKKDFEVFKEKLFDLSEMKWEEVFRKRRAIPLSKEVRARWRGLLADGPEADKDTLIQLIFSSLDHDDNFVLNYTELYQADLVLLHPNLDLTLTGGCQFRDFLRFQDTDEDDRIGVIEFFAAFAHLYGVSMISLDKALEHKTISATPGTDLVLVCDISGSPPTSVIWDTPHKSSAPDPHLVHSGNGDGSLTILAVGHQHQGNYSCRSVRNSAVVQVLELIVTSVPEDEAIKHIPDANESRSSFENGDLGSSSDTYDEYL